MKIHGEIADNGPGVADNVHHSNAWHCSVVPISHEIIDLQWGLKSYPMSCRLDLVGGFNHPEK